MKAGAGSPVCRLNLSLRQARTMSVASKCRPRKSSLARCLSLAAMADRIMGRLRKRSGTLSRYG